MSDQQAAPIEVLHVVTRMNVGGPALEIENLMRGITASHIRQMLLTGECGPTEEDHLINNPSDISVTHIKGLGRRISPLSDLAALVAVMRFLRVNRPQIVHTHTAKAGVIGRLAARMSGTSPQIVHTFHGHLLHGYFGPLTTRLVVLLERLLARITNANVAVGKRVRDDLLAHGIGRPAQYHVIHSGVKLQPLPSKNDVRVKMGIPEDVVVVTMLGRLVPIKRPDRLAEVARLAKNENLNCLFLVAGGGESEREFRLCIEEEQLPVSLLGWVSDVESLLSATDVVILVSDNEGLPLSLLQAAIAGKPALATNVGSVPELITHQQTGLLSEPDAESLFVQLKHLIDADYREGLGERARICAMEKYNFDIFLQKHQELYESLVRYNEGNEV